MMKFELLTTEGVSAGNVELDPAHITQIERGTYGRDRIESAGGWFFVRLSASQLAAIYRVLAERLEHEEKEALRAVESIK